MRVIIEPDSKTAFQQAALILAHEIRTAENPVLGLATGHTVEAIYACLAREHAENGLDFSHTRTFNLDEYVGLRLDDPHSSHYRMQEDLFSRVNIPPENIHVLDGNNPHRPEECATFEETITEAGGIGIQLLAIGLNGHIAFNEAPADFDSRTRLVHLTPVTRRQRAPLFGGNPQNVPRRALTMGLGTILQARRLVLVAVGTEKAPIITQTLLGPVTRENCASAIHLHPDCTVILDEDAAALWHREKDALTCEHPA
ncbi:glucosamine-6-phosphate deaminase [Gluconobacter morbifer]|uniref:6-phosphogluconolactonase/Glucosamine-6-phosphate isomerase/deaminase n=1 Tax=Gluconobacter morbifer G707 TaxID=1088869 RepID=G6XMK2_9PROT|nr:glucosamine-6-phosphate deaminase [Gluconobacter morbifer]EHH67101.1 6-phosphogluconolactonase/Glucosamine-6-phosphate isomerase/deaminase [Gluconobacter morbifer G707]